MFSKIKSMFSTKSLYVNTNTMIEVYAKPTLAAAFTLIFVLYSSKPEVSNYFIIAMSLLLFSLPLLLFPISAHTVLMMNKKKKYLKPTPKFFSVCVYLGFFSVILAPTLIISEMGSMTPFFALYFGLILGVICMIDLSLKINKMEEKKQS